MRDPGSDKVGDFAADPDPGPRIPVLNDSAVSTTSVYLLYYAPCQRRISTARQRALSNEAPVLRPRPSSCGRCVSPACIATSRSKFVVHSPKRGCSKTMSVGQRRRLGNHPKAESASIRPVFPTCGGCTGGWLLRGGNPPAGSHS